MGGGGGVGALSSAHACPKVVAKSTHEVSEAPRLETLAGGLGEACAEEISVDLALKITCRERGVALRGHWLNRRSEMAAPAAVTAPVERGGPPRTEGRTRHPSAAGRFNIRRDPRPTGV
jgi:hypothetical protein